MSTKSTHGVATYIPHSGAHIESGLIQLRLEPDHSSYRISNEYYIFIVSLRRFIAVRGKPTTIWSDYGTNFMGAARELKDLYTHLGNAQTEHVIDKFCAD